MKKVFIMIFTCFFLVTSFLIGTRSIKGKQDVNNDNTKLDSIYCMTNSESPNSKYRVDSLGFPVLTDSDSIRLIKFAKRDGKYESSVSKVDGKFYIENLFFLLPRVFGICDSIKYDSLSLLYYQSKGDIKYNNEWQLCYQMLFNDAVVIGNVIDVQTNYDFNQLLHYKTTITIEVQEVLFSNNNLDNNDYVIVKLQSGLLSNIEMGDKLQNNEQRLFIENSNDEKLAIGDTRVFFLSHSNYYSWFLHSKRFSEKNRYNDIYCSNAYVIKSSFDLNEVDAISKINQLKTLSNRLK